MGAPLSNRRRTGDDEAARRRTIDAFAGVTRTANIRHGVEAQAESLF